MIYLLCNNYSYTHDGIGSYCEKIYKESIANGSIRLFTKRTKKEGLIRRFFSLNMTLETYRLLKEIKKIMVEGMIIEYPFIECNPLIIFPIKKIRKYCQKKNIKFFVSLHEYERTSFIRKFIIRQIIKKSDLLYVTDKNMEYDLNKFVKHIKIRRIPANIYNSQEIDFSKKNKYIFAYFGLINSSKAFEEMVEAWNLFVTNHPNLPLQIKIITSSEYDCSKIKNSKYYHNLSDEEINIELEEVLFSILPIRPCIGEGNTTMKTLMSNGCVIIGKFSDKLINQYPGAFVFLDGLSSGNIYESLLYSMNIDEDKIRYFCVNSKRYSYDFNPQDISEEFIKSLMENVINGNQ